MPDLVARIRELEEKLDHSARRRLETARAAEARIRAADRLAEAVKVVDESWHAELAGLPLVVGDVALPKPLALALIALRAAYQETAKSPAETEMEWRIASAEQADRRRNAP